MALQRVWDAKLAKAGFRDIESGQDTNRIDGSTFRGPSDGGGHGVEISTGLEQESGKGRHRGSRHTKRVGADVLPSVFTSPIARAWMMFGQAAHELPTDRRTRAFLLDVAEHGNIKAAARRHRMSYRWQARPLARRLCEAIGVEFQSLFGAAVDGSPGRGARTDLAARKVAA